ncbi:heme/copper-type cytochrome/quinol oxidase subunit 2 [Pseudomonas viridiflava]
MSNSLSIELERYKYILARKQSLNEATFKIAAIYQVIIVGLGIGQYNVMVALQSRTIDQFTALSATIMLAVFIAMLSSLIISLLIGGVFAWLKYRREETQILSTAANIDKDAVSFWSIFRWYETYLVIVVFAMGLISLLTYYYILIPHIKSLG